jgi:preprotein translocase subunit SecE
MDVKLNPSKSSSEASTHQALRKKPMLSFVQELKEELKKVTWTTKEELKLSTKVVIGSIFVFGLGIYLFDLMIKGALDCIALVVHFIFG